MATTTAKKETLTLATKQSKEMKAALKEFFPAEAVEYLKETKKRRPRRPFIEGIPYPGPIYKSAVLSDAVKQKLLTESVRFERAQAEFFDCIDNLLTISSKL
ncbi:MAG: hypothetical protein II892_01405 [Fibrobacter sp.]|nr:hypothetical protein [Fibrobacter sp.]